ncbi:phage tail protein [Marinobacterium sp. AK62]|uniref:Phage tail protein n=1 Tax=Marinobacterium alkalitolerans TaxID=1542925 RepID=A0ABS3Z7G1_9GAMM|nr:phage tail protein [Marinobacterium alkalitolerans]MBP0047647.1 phage tail protein [Marinobacterium alkalitolerans]
MANFPGLILTNAGRQLQAKAQIGQQLQFTRVALGSGYEPAEPESLTALVDEKQSLSIQSFEVIGDGTSKIRAILTNEGVSTGFFVREIGVFARDPDTLEEQLYAYSNSGTQSDFLPAEGGATVVEQIFDLVTVIGNAANVTAVIDDYITLATKADIEEIRPYILPEGGLTGQLLRKATNAEGDTEWFDPAETLNVHVHSITEERIAVEGQQVFNLAETRTQGLAVYKNGDRLPPSQWSALNATQVRLDQACAAGDQLQFVNNEEVGVNSLARVSLTGPDLVYPGSSNTYTITDYDDFSTYTVVTDVGTASITGDTITLDIDAGEAAGNLTLTVTRNNGNSAFSIAVGSQTIAAPEVLNPANGATDVGETPTLTTSAFATYPSGADTHASTDWQVATDAAFTAVVWESLGDVSNLESIAVPPGTLSTSTTYYVRARHSGSSLGASGWSNAVSFITKDRFYPSDEVATLLASDGNAYDEFGFSVDISADGAVAVVGARYDSDIQDKGGSAYIFTSTGGSWQQVIKLTAPTVRYYGLFGDSVSISDDATVIAISESNVENGVHVFRFDGSSYIHSATLPEKAYSIAVSGDGATIVIGNAVDSTEASNAGILKVYTFDGSNWVFVQSLTAPDAAQNDYLGMAVAINGDGSTVVGGAPSKNLDNGAAYIFSNSGSGYTSAAILTSDMPGTTRFGIDVALDASGAVCAIGSDYDGSVVSNGGAAFIYRDSDGYSLEAKVSPSDVASNDNFARAISLSNDGSLLLCGAPLNDQHGSTNGMAYVFSGQNGSWSELGKIYGAGANMQSANFGQSVSISGDKTRAIVGAFYSDSSGTNSGSAHIFE